MTGSPRLGDDSLQLVDLCLGAAECAELCVHVSGLFSEADSVRKSHQAHRHWERLEVVLVCLWNRTYSLLGQLSCPLVLGVAEQLDHSALIRSKTGDFLDDFADKRGAFGEVALCAGDAGFVCEGGGFLQSRVSAYMAVNETLEVWRPRMRVKQIELSVA